MWNLSEQKCGCDSFPRTFPKNSSANAGEIEKNQKSIGATIWPKSGPFPRVFWMNVSALSERKRIFLKTKKADQKHCEDWHAGLIQNSWMCERVECRKQLRDFITQSLKQTHLGSGTFSRLFWSNGPQMPPTIKNKARYKMEDSALLHLEPSVMHSWIVLTIFQWLKLSHLPYMIRDSTHPVHCGWWHWSRTTS